MADLSRVVDRFMARQKLGAMSPWQDAQTIVRKHRRGIDQDFNKLLGRLGRAMKRHKLTLDLQKSWMDWDWKASEGSAWIMFDLTFTDDLTDFRTNRELEQIMEDEFELYGRLNYKGGVWNLTVENS